MLVLYLYITLSLHLFVLFLFCVHTIKRFGEFLIEQSQESCGFMSYDILSYSNGNQFGCGEGRWFGLGT